MARALAAKLQALYLALNGACEDIGTLPDRIEVARPRTALDGAAIDIFRAVLAKTPGSPPVVIVDQVRRLRRR
jgi:hypothetical protein